jgi:hypothetical protein
MEDVRAESLGSVAFRNRVEFRGEKLGLKHRFCHVPFRIPYGGSSIVLQLSPRGLFAIGA